jgi:hypothetical protein
MYHYILMHINMQCRVIWYYCYLSTCDTTKDTLSQNNLIASTIFNCYLNILKLNQVSNVRNVSNINGRLLDCLFKNGDVASICPGDSLVPKADLPTLLLSLI